MDLMDQMRKMSQVGYVSVWVPPPPLLVVFKKIKKEPRKTDPFRMSFSPEPPEKGTTTCKSTKNPKPREVSHLLVGDPVFVGSMPTCSGNLKENSMRNFRGVPFTW